LIDKVGLNVSLIKNIESLIWEVLRRRLLINRNKEKKISSDEPIAEDFVAKWAQNQNITAPVVITTQPADLQCLTIR
jgi:hypothetical protein